MQGMVNRLLGRYKGRDLDLLDMLITIALMVTDESTKLDQAPYAKSIVIGGVTFFYVRGVSPPLVQG